MNNIDSLSTQDFYFNGHYLSEYGGVIAGKDGFKLLSALPQLDIKSEKILGRHGELFYEATYSPRTFVVPVLFSNITNIRTISSWLNALSPQDFYFKNDTVKIKCMIDGVVDIDSYCYQGVVELKFIAHSTFFEAINDKSFSLEKSATASTTTVGNLTTIKKTSLTTSTSITNDGNKESFPKISVYGTGTITVSINTNTFTVVLDSTGNDYVTIDTKYLTVYKSADNRIGSMTLINFPTLNVGTNTVSATTTCTKILIECRSEWI